MKHVQTFILALLLAIVFGVSIGTLTRAQPIIPDPCRVPDILKLATPLNVSGTTATELLPVVGSTGIAVCGFTASLAGTTPSLLVRYGTGTACATSPTNLTGTILPTSGQMINLENGGVIWRSPAGQALCVTLGGTTPSLQGVLTYVRQ